MDKERLREREGREKEQSVVSEKQRNREGNYGKISMSLKITNILFLVANLLLLKG